MIVKKLAIAALLVLSTQVNASDYEVTEYKMEWPIFSASSLSVNLVTDQDKTSVVIMDTDAYKRLSLTPLSAEGVAAVLAKAREYRKSQDSAEGEVTSKEKVGNIQVSFRTSSAQGFSVTLSTGSFTGRVTLTLNEAMQIADAISDAKSKAAFIENAIKI